VYEGARSYYEHILPGGAAAVAQALDTETRAFFEQIFLGTAMYEILPILPISEAAARLMDLPHLEFVRRNSVWLAEHDLRGVYALFIRALPPETVALRLPKLALKYFDFGHTETRMESDRLCVGEMQGIPVVLAAWMQACIQGYVPTALSIAGAKNPRVRMLETTGRASERPEGTTTLRIEIRWV
jgi:F0F1-type ATP synthase membrane subunit c/vacuolar-type H+-ATPase subunit K